MKKTGKRKLIIILLAVAVCIGVSLRIIVCMYSYHLIWADGICL